MIAKCHLSIMALNFGVPSAAFPFTNNCLRFGWAFLMKVIDLSDCGTPLARAQMSTDKPLHLCHSGIRVTKFESQKSAMAYAACAREMDILEILAPTSNAQTDVQAFRCAIGRSIYYQGDQARTWFSVSEGVVRTCRYSPEGTRQITGFQFPGDVFGLEEGYRADTAEAVTCVALRELPYPISGAGESQSRYELALRKALLQASKS